MKVKLFTVDESYYGVDNIITPVVKLASEYESFTIILCEILNFNCSYNAHICNDVKTALKYAEYRIDKKNSTEYSKYQLFSELVYDFYWKIAEDDVFEDEMRKYNSTQFQKKEFYYPDKRMSVYRGLMLEELLYQLVEKRFEGEMLRKGCRVVINGLMVQIGYNYGNINHKQTVDIAGWVENTKYGEFYECKVSPYNFKQPNYIYLKELKDNLNGANSTMVAFVSADATRNLLSKKSEIEFNTKMSSDFEVFGRDKIFSLKGFCVPEIA